MVKVLYDKGDTLKAEKIIITARKFPQKKISKKRTSADKLQQLTAEGTATAVIAKPMRAVRDSK